jgi:hypothetical protein
MRAFSKTLILFAALASSLVVAPAATPPTPAAYVPQAVYCYRTPSTHGPVLTGLCPNIPGDIGADPALGGRSFGYKGIIHRVVTSQAEDIETPFDNLSWQTFVGLNWTAGKQHRPPAEGLKGSGARVWQGWDRVSSVFGNSAVQANCHPLLGEQVFSIASNGNGTPAIHNEEYIQAATGDPAIDVNGNWTIYERRLNGTEIAYLHAPGGHKEWDLTTAKGQGLFDAVATNKIDFPSVASRPGAPTGAMEIKAAWRILDPASHAANAKRFFTTRAVLAVAPDLVFHGAKPPAPICAHVELGLVAMHIIQKNPPTKNALRPEWFWTTFEHVDNAPLAKNPCDVTDPGACGTLNQLQCPAAALLGAPPYSYYDARHPEVPTNQPPALLLGGKSFLWNPVPPYAKSFLTTAKDGTRVGTQISRCWAIYTLTQQLNAQWQAKLRSVGSVFANYMLVGTQWGAALESATPPAPPVGPTDAVPNYLSNTTLETYLQTYNQPNGAGVGSCVSCHSGANLATNQAVLSNFSFLPGLVSPLLQTRRAPLPPDAAPPK